MKHLLYYFKPYIKESFLAPLFKLLEAVFELLVPMVIAGIVDQSIPKKDQGHLWMQMGLLFIFAVIGVLVALVAQFYSAKAAVGFAKELTNDLYRHILSLPKDSRDRLTTSSLVTRLTSDTYQIQTGINQFLRLFLRAPIIVFGAIFMAYRLSPELTFWFLVMVAILSFVIVVLSRLVNPLYSSLRKKTDQLVQETRQQIQGMRVIRAFGQEKREIEQFQVLNQIYTAIQMKTGYWSSLLTPLTYLIVNGTLLVIIWNGYLSIQGGWLSQGALIALINYLLQILVELIKLAMLINSLNQSYISAKRIEEVFTEEPEDIHSEIQVEKVSGHRVLQVSHLTFTYPDAAQPSLRDISFDMQQGEILGIIGGTGSGKSTLVQVLLGLYPADKGSISLYRDERSPRDLSEWRSWMAYVPQKVELFKGTIRSNLTLGMEEPVSDKELWQALEIAQAKDFVSDKEGQLDAEVQAGGRNFSGGQKQRLSIARAVLRQAPFLILDDATSALDTITESNLLKAIQENLPDTSLILISQRTSTLKIADQILLLEKGQQSALGNHEELMKSSQVYREINASQHGKED
ncbi:ABC transporter ATP-binding protein [Streptococcus infantis]|uniref:ABC transporter ATP-binding protein n=1 Tax=Streptococcus infantis TaxID=68892 RepID=UPI001CBDD80D|nr:ABC transporter ATP-binding protein [Streptococcus infantis]MBZ2110322.1 ABC transporter ATP-binding protein/permease [Streptococcus infantis]MBZ2112170.1 ABC transporter ATP-binding protein/permease [Streptococcus infantis]MBZ2118889.1 ABC transporter ATP-binding protein/permease [Streptococcus infantis]